jgi:ribosomal protein L29
MKKSAKTDLRAKSAEDMAAEAKTLRGELLKSRFAASTEGKTIGVKYRVARRQIARLETLITEKAADKAAKKA